MDDNKDPPALAEVSSATNHTRGLLVSGYIRYIARAITVLAKPPAPEELGNAMPAPTKTDDGNMLLPSRRINDLLWKRMSSKDS